MKFLSVACSLSLLLLVACGGSEPAPDAAPEVTPEAEEETPCCSIDDVIEMSKAGVDDDIIIASIANSEQEIEPTAQDLITLSEAGVSKPVIQVLMGEDPDEVAAEEAKEEAKEAAAEDAKKAPAKPKGPPPLSLAIAYAPGAKKFTITNTSGRTYTGLVLTANGDYVYALPVPLPPGNPDSIRLGSFTSRATGHKLHPAEGLKRLHVKAQQGSYSRTF